MSKKKKSRRAGAPPNLPKKQSAAETYAQQARQHKQNGETQRAIERMEQAIALAPGNAKLHQELGCLYLGGKQGDDGVRHLEQSLALNGDLFPALIALGQHHVKKNAFDAGRPLLERAVANAPEHPVAYLAYGTLFQKQGQLPDAVENFREALRWQLKHPIKAATPAKPSQDFNKAETEQLMWTTLSLLAKAGVHAFACYGTLLGLIREGGLLPFDKDIDFGLPHSEMPLAVRCLERNGWVEDAGNILTNPRAFVHPPTGVSLDLSGFVVDAATSETFTGFWLDDVPQEWNRHTRYPEVRLDKARSPDDAPVWSLAEPETWLETIYGEWRVPDPDFDTVIAAKNLCKFSLLPQTYAFSRIYHKWEHGQISKALALVGHTRRHMPDDDLLQQVEAHLKTLDDKTPTAAESGTPVDDTSTTLAGIDETFGARFAPPADRLSFDN